MKVVIALLAAVILLAASIPLSRAISEGEEHSIVRTVDAVSPAEEAAQTAGLQASQPDEAQVSAHEAGKQQR